MRLEEFRLKPGQQVDIAKPIPTSSFGDVLQYIEKNCSEFLTHARQTHKVLYRGIKGNHPDIFIGYPRIDRVRKRGGVSEDYAKVGDYCDKLLSMMGFTALRSNSIFCNSVLFNVLSWGEAWTIFPLNGYSFCYSADKTDIAAGDYYWPNFELVSYGPGELVDFLKHTKLDRSYAELFVQDNEFRDTDINKALAIGHDIWIRGEFIAISNKYIEHVNTGLELNIKYGPVERIFKSDTKANLVPTSQRDYRKAVDRAKRGVIKHEGQ